MKTNFPVSKNVLTPLHALTVKPVQILDFGRYTIRVAGQTGWYRSEINVGNFTGELKFDGQICHSEDELPPQVAIALGRASYMVAEYA